MLEDEGGATTTHTHKKNALAVGAERERVRRRRVPAQAGDVLKPGQAQHLDGAGAGRHHHVLAIRAVADLVDVGAKAVRFQRLVAARVEKGDGVLARGDGERVAARVPRRGQPARDGDAGDALLLPRVPHAQRLVRHGRELRLLLGVPLQA